MNITVSFVQFIDDPFLRSEQKSCPVQLPLALSGWGFREEFSTCALKSEKVEDDAEPMETMVEGKSKLFPQLALFSRHLLCDITKRANIAVI